LKSYKIPGTDQIPAELIKAGSETLCSEKHKLIHSIWNKEELPQQWKESIIILPIHKRVIRQTVIFSRSLLLLNCLQNFIQQSSGQVNSICQ
jgi:hypothetical protein